MNEASQITGMDSTLAGDGPVDELGFVRVHHFDAGTMGCADGLADAFRDRIRAIPLGEHLVVVARDPAAKGDLPSLARLLGQTIRSTEAANDGRLMFTIERTR